MTAASPPPDDDLPRDPAFDDAWRALSAEEPPAAIDAALRAAARREVDAGPRIAVADRIATPRATKPMNWWRPLAVAATLGALAVGLVQLVTPERVGAPGHDAAVVSDLPPAQAAESAKKQSAEATQGAAATPEEQARMMQAPAAPAPHSTDRKDAPPPPSEPPASAGSGGARKELQSHDAVSAFPQAATTDELARQDAAAERKRDAGTNAAPAVPAANVEAPANAPARVAERPAPPASTVAPVRTAEPFPADRANRGDATMKREGATEESVARAPDAPAAAGIVAPSPEESAADKPVVAPKPAADNRTAPLAKLKARPMADVNERAAAATDSASSRREQDAQASAPATSTLQAAAPSGKIEARGGTHPALPVPDWIALIRRLIAEKNFTAAEKELAAFRAAHSDAKQLLPQDLRDWTPPR